MTEGLAHLSRMDICEQGPDVERAFSSDELSLGANQGTHADKVVRSLPNIDDAYQPRVQPPSTDKVVIAVEVCLKPRTTVRHDEIRQAVERMLDKRSLTYEEGPILFCQTDEPFLYEHVESITLSDEDGRASANGVLLFWQVTLQVHVYQLHEEGPSEELEGNDSIASFHEWTLPGREFHGLWESLIYDSSLKQHLLRYALSALLFSDRGVNSHLVAWNRVVLLHGPPGTGKTSLCKALAQKLSIQFSYRFPQAQLVEVNAHSLFSKWFSESGKLVTKLFQKIEDIVEDGTTLVFVLIDEAESLTAARQAALSGSEPSDSIRVVNALLTQLDRLKRWPNVVVLTTSNISAAIDLAFVDRADIKAYVGPPSLEARYEILRSCLKELQRVGIINQQKVEPYDSELLTFKILSLRMKERTEEARVLLSVDISRNLLAVAEACEGFSGRALRKLPFLAHASMGPLTDCDYSVFLAAMHEAIKRELSDRALM
ncbi:pachytene checkpoint protein 2 [Marchantia polymorpha subsp. ruderalis]|uniref:Pachytene checkpoint protein 2 homolog n=2 Tax=Marchantia polymorpha TaxID=3197 RepID=A0A176VP42_MARPO|nr:hypothetical protein AXG93_3719s1200 [Marchantia polymorpha subsp. ruderalis]PTQ33974.1 hypothetical protein MARPO_0084s0055 [Marchantia polymorpha]PTQ33975.1 hypothetical protein MARPO_0084s0055 [Marchantia polymorpha]PTQ33976.1 hypothetical protein MARPO_0084s0055 [Marchantia polymorpha]BBN12187.1 hypothetical protein Mp_5g18080 [Marchantia polymorpha subsp. ruderalis]|eukprot:PTQ33974.1 hypothetical protein MARPO_0084s0055 [Marchantia polymorpha]